MESILIQPELLILPFLLLAVFGLCLHVLLWRNIVVETLSLELLRIEIALLTEIPRQLHADKTMLRLRRLLTNSRRNAGSLVFTRLLLAAILLPRRDRKAGSCRERLLAYDHIASREISLRLYGQFEKAVIRRMAAGSPLLWMLLLYGRIFRARDEDGGQFSPGMDSLEFTFPISPSRES
jgi:hypothetical protein